MRYVRLPVGSNTKHDPAHPHRLLVWNPDVRVSLTGLIDVLGVDRAILNEPAVAPPTVAARTSTASSGGVFRAVNDAALGNLAAWVPDIFPAAKPYQGGYRVASKALGRALQEDLSLLPEGIQDFGEEHGQTAIDVVLTWSDAASPSVAALWLCGRMGIEPASLGWSDSTESRGAEDLPTAIATVSSAIDALSDDPGAVLTDATVDAWALVYGRDAAEYERLRHRAKAAGARVAEIDRAIGARSKYAKERAGKKKNENQVQSYTSCTSSTGRGSSSTETYTELFQPYTSCTDPLPVTPTRPRRTPGINSAVHIGSRCNHRRRFTRRLLAGCSRRRIGLVSRRATKTPC